MASSTILQCERIVYCLRSGAWCILKFAASHRIIEAHEDSVTRIPPRGGNWDVRAGNREIVICPVRKSTNAEERALQILALAGVNTRAARAGYSFKV